MTLSNEGWELAHTLANQDASVDQLAGLLITAMTADTGKPFNPRPMIETVLFSVRLSCRKIVVEEYARYTDDDVPQANVMTARIIDRIVAVDGVRSVEDNRSWSAKRIEELETARILDRINGADTPVETNEPLPLKRLTDLERRVEALEAAKVHPADRMAATLPERWIGLKENGGLFDVCVITDDRATEILKVFDNRHDAREFAIQYAADQGYEYRD